MADLSRRWAAIVALVTLSATGAACGRREEPPPVASEPASPVSPPETTAQAGAGADTAGYLDLPDERLATGDASPVPAASRTTAPGAARSSTAAARTVLPANPEAVPGYDHDLPVEDLPLVAERVAPSYPEAARRAGIQGVVVTRALVLSDLSVGDVRVTQSIPELDQAAIECVRRWRFRPAKAKDAPLPVWVAVPVVFSLP